MFFTRLLIDVKLTVLIFMQFHIRLASSGLAHRNLLNFKYVIIIFEHNEAIDEIKSCSNDSQAICTFHCIDQSEHSDLIWLEELATEK